MFKVISSVNGRTVASVNFHTIDAAFEAVKAELAKGRTVELCDMDTSMMLSSDCPAAVVLR